MDTQVHPEPSHLSTRHKLESFYVRNAVALQWGIIGVAFLAACGIYWWRTTSALEAHAMIQLVMAQDAEDYAAIATDSAGTQAASWAKLREANGYLDTALRDAFSNREKANTDLDKAVVLLASLKDVSGPSELKEQVLFAHARSLEMTSDGKLEPAIEAYETLIKKFPKSSYRRDAEERLHSLQQPSAKEFYAFFAKQNPKPSDPARPNDEKAKKTDDPLKPLSFGVGDQKPALDSGLGIPAPPSLLNKTSIPAEGPAIPETPEKDTTEAKPETTEEKTETKAEEKAEAKPQEKPAEPKPVEEKAAETPEAKPETEKPAEDAKP